MTSTTNVGYPIKYAAIKSALEECVEALAHCRAYVEQVNNDYPRVPIDENGLYTGADPERDELLDRAEEALAKAKEALK